MNSLVILISTFIAISIIIFIAGGGNSKPKPEPEPEPELELELETKELKMIVEEKQNKLQPMDAPIPPRSLDGLQYINYSPVGEGFTDTTTIDSNRCGHQQNQSQ